MNEALFLGYCKITNSIIPDSFDFYWQPPRRGLRSRQGQRIAGRGRVTRTASTPVCFIATAPTRIWARLWSTACGRSASAPSSSRSSAPPFSPATPARNTHAASFAGRAAPLATPRRGSPRLSSRAAPMPMAAIPISTSFSPSRPTSSITRSARRSSKRSSSWSTKRRFTRRSGSSPFINGIGPRVGKSAFGLIPGFAYTAPFEDITIKGA